MNKLHIIGLIGLLLGSQLSYASQINDRIDVASIKKQRYMTAVYFSGAAIALSGAVISATATQELRQHPENDNYYTMYVFATPMAMVGAAIMGASLVALKNYQQQSERHHRNLGEYQAMRIGEDNV